jgi:hypothetical protein
MPNYKELDIIISKFRRAHQYTVGKHTIPKLNWAQKKSGHIAFGSILVSIQVRKKSSSKEIRHIAIGSILVFKLGNSPTLPLLVWLYMPDGNACRVLQPLAECSVYGTLGSWAPI